ncbi:MAG: AAA family ATPase [Candidatus Dojkabacteria bacterium]
MKIIVSGWPGCGSTTLSLILAKSLNLKLYRGSASHRFFLDKLNIPQTGEGVIAMETLIQPFWGPIYDRYCKDLFLDNIEDNMIIDSDLTGFLVGKNPSILSIFLHSTKEARIKHFAKDGRVDDGNMLDQIDQKVFREYRDLYKINFLDLNEVTKSYSLVIDNGEMTLEKELGVVYQELKMNYGMGTEQAGNLIKSARFEETDYWNFGKNKFIEILKNTGQLVSGEEIVKAISLRYPDEIKKLPENLQQAIASIK